MRRRVRERMGKRERESFTPAGLKQIREVFIFTSPSAGLDSII